MALDERPKDVDLLVEIADHIVLEGIYNITEDESIGLPLGNPMLAALRFDKIVQFNLGLL